MSYMWPFLRTSWRSSWLVGFPTCRVLIWCWCRAVARCGQSYACKHAARREALHGACCSLTSFLCCLVALYPYKAKMVRWKKASYSLVAHMVNVWKVVNYHSLCILSLASFPGPSQILSRSRGEKHGRDLGMRLYYHDIGVALSSAHFSYQVS